MVLSGNSVAPALYDLLRCHDARQAPERAPNLTWKPDGEERVNQFTFIPRTLDYVDIAPERMQNDRTVLAAARGKLQGAWRTAQWTS